MKKSGIVLLHLGYWTCYLFLMLFIALLLHNQFIFRGFGLIVFLSSFAFIPALLGFYSFYTILFASFLKRKKIIALVIMGTIISFAYGCIGWLLLDLAWKHIPPFNKAAIDRGGFTEII